MKGRACGSFLLTNFQAESIFKSQDFWTGNLKNEMQNISSSCSGVFNGPFLVQFAAQTSRTTTARRLIYIGCSAQQVGLSQGHSLFQNGSKHHTNEGQSYHIPWLESLLSLLTFTQLIFLMSAPEGNITSTTQCQF